MNYGKYIDSTGTHWISNSGSDENGRAHGGAAGDQNGNEWRLRAWYNRPWGVVLRHPDSDVRRKLAELGIAAALNDKIGYDQYQRTTYWQRLQEAGYDPSAIQVPCEADCTAGVTANAKAVGYLLGISALKALAIDTYSGNMKIRLMAAGFQALTQAKYLTSYEYLLPGDILLYEGHHAATNITRGAKAGSVIADEHTITLRLGGRILKNGMAGADVAELQTALILLGYSCGSWGADGDFGDSTEIAVKQFQARNGCLVDGEVGPETVAALKKVQQIDPEAPRTVAIVGGNCYVRSAPNTSGTILGVAHEGATLPYGGQTGGNGWLLVEYAGQNAWVSGKYGRLV